VAFLNLLILVISSRWMGADVRGQINLFVLNLSLIHGVNEIYSGFTLVYFIPRFNHIKIYQFGFIWIVSFSIIISSLFFLFQSQMQVNVLHLGLIAIILSVHIFNTVFLLAKEQIKLFNLINFVQPFLLLCSLFVLLFIIKERTFNAYLIALYSSFLPALAISTFFVSKSLKANNAIQYDLRAILKNGFYNQLAALSHVFSNRLNFYLLSSNVMLGVFGNATSLTESIWLISSSAAPIILTRISNSDAGKNNALLTLNVAKICFLMSILFSIVLLLLPNALFVYALGKDFSSVKWLMLNLSPGILFISFATIISHFYAGNGNQKILVFANLCGFFTTLVTSAFLIQNYQLLGACYATNLSYLVASLILFIKFIRDFNFSFRDLFSLK
jgi:O-antigen/teichoic acid export membrane protein